MDKSIVRLLTLEIKGLKNVEFGKIDMPNAFDRDYSIDKSEILGIYGQNGSGKTAVIDSLGFLKILLTGSSLPKDAVHFISKSAGAADCSYRFLIQRESFRSIVNYQFILTANDNDLPEIRAEKLSYSNFEEGKWQRETTLLEYNTDNSSTVFTPKYRYDKLVSNDKENKVRLNVAKIVSLKESKSFIFSDEVRQIILNDIDDISWTVIESLRYFAVANLFVIKNGHSSVISLDFVLPFSFKHKIDGGYAIGDMAVSLSEPTILDNDSYSIFVSMLDEMDSVIKSLVPGLSISVKQYGPQVDKDGKEGMRFEVLSTRCSISIPIKYESEGIKKVLSVLNIVIAMYNNPSVCVAIDELDAGIFEYLLGELLAVLEESGKGQLIFTSHNLRPLEMIRKTSLVFTTTNPLNRYIRLANVKSNNNLRDLYLRAINLGGQKEQIYEPTKEFEIRRALHRAGIVWHSETG